jgi:hypothetical protein
MAILLVSSSIRRLHNTDWWTSCERMYKYSHIEERCRYLHSWRKTGFRIWAVGSSRIITKRLVRRKLALIKCADTLPFDRGSVAKPEEKGRS